MPCIMPNKMPPCNDYSKVLYCYSPFITVYIVFASAVRWDVIPPELFSDNVKTEPMMEALNIRSDVSSSWVLFLCSLKIVRDRLKIYP